MKHDAAQRYPLTWPTGWKRTPAGARLRSGFAKSRTDQVRQPDGSVRAVRRGSKLSVYDATMRLEHQLDSLGATDEILSTNIQLRLDGRPRSDKEPPDPGAAVYFRLHRKARVLACDRWQTVAGNIAALAQHIDALRRIDRYGVGSLEQAFAGYAALPAAPEEWWLVLGISREASVGQVQAAYERLAKVAHPDVGGSDHAMARLNVARDTALAEREVLA